MKKPPLASFDAALEGALVVEEDEEDGLEVGREVPELDPPTIPTPPKSVPVDVDGGKKEGTGVDLDVEDKVEGVVEVEVEEITEVVEVGETRGVLLLALGLVIGVAPADDRLLARLADEERLAAEEEEASATLDNDESTDS